MTLTQTHDVTDLGLADEGQALIEWADAQMPVLRTIRERFKSERPFKGRRVSGCLHVTTETANLALALQAGGADLVLCASNPLSTNDAVAAALVLNHEIPVFARKGEDRDTYYRHLNAALDHRPELTMDDGADLVSLLHTEPSREALSRKVIGGTEETSTGVFRLRSMAKAGVLRFPVVAVNDAMTKHMFDNRYGTGQSALDGIIRSTNVLLAGRVVVVAGYGWCGRGVASRARGLGARVIVTEVEPVNALEALMDGFEVSSMDRAAAEGDLFVTVTGGLHALGAAHLAAMKDGAIVANSGHFNDEIDIPALEAMSAPPATVRPFVQAYRRKAGGNVFLLAEGRLINLAAAEGHPAAVMDMSFANQALGLEWLLKNREELSASVHSIPEDIDREIARIKLESLGVKIDSLSEAQQRYAQGWEAGT